LRAARHVGAALGRLLAFVAAAVCLLAAGGVRFFTRPECLYGAGALEMWLNNFPPSLIRRNPICDNPEETLVSTFPRAILNPLDILSTSAFLPRRR
jgi:hypothetical protein